MKLYYFNPNTWGKDYYVVSDSKENAIAALNKYLVDNHNQEYFEQLVQWGSVYFENYTISVFEPNEVIETEVS